MWKLYAACTAVLLVPAAAQAQSWSPAYVSVKAGANFAPPLQSAQDTIRIDTDPGPAVVAALGWNIGHGLQAELEGSYRSNSISNIYTLRENGQTLPFNTVHGANEATAVMANLIYDVPAHRNWPVRPYIGAGLGYGWLNANGGGEEPVVLHLPQNNTYNGPGQVSYGQAGAFAYQVMAGLSWPVSRVRGLEMTAEYRFFGTTRADVPATAVGSTNVLFNGAVPTGFGRRGFEITDSSLLVGLRYRFAG